MNMKFLCAVQNPGTIAIYVLLIVALIAMLVMPYFTQRKKNQEYMKILEGIHVGDLVKTAGGIIGKVTKITDKGDIKTVVLETGSKSEKSYMELDITMIYCVLKSTKAPVEESDKTETVETKTEKKKKAKVEETKTEEKAEEEKIEEVKVEETKVEDKTEEKPAKKTTKKTSTKKTTKK